MAARCKRCGSEEQVKNGFMKGLQRYRCKACGLNFTETPPRGIPLHIASMARFARFARKTSIRDLVSMLA